MAYTSNDVVPPAIRKLVDLLRDETVLHGVEVEYGPARNPEQAHVFVGDSIDDDDIDWATVGKSSAGAKLDFETTFTVTAYSGLGGETAQESLERAYEMRGVVERVLRTENDRSTAFDLPQVLAVRVLWARQRHTFYEHDEGVACSAGLVVRIQARL